MTRKMGWLSAAIGLAFALICVAAGAEERLGQRETTTIIPLVEGKPHLHVIHEGRSAKVQRIQDPDYLLQGYFAKPGRKCPPFCIQPVSAAPGVATIGEVELFEFMETKLRDGSGVLIDARTRSWYRKGTIPGSVNYPFSLFSQRPGAPEVVALLETLGVQERTEVGAVGKLLEELDLVETENKTARWDFAAAKEVVLWCNGPACGQSPRAIRGLLATGYPSDRIKYYRGGMQMWQLWGLTTIVPQS